MEETQIIKSQNGLKCTHQKIKNFSGVLSEKVSQQKMEETIRNSQRTIDQQKLV